MIPVIDMTATGKKIKEVRERCGLTVRDVQNYFGFLAPQAIYSWERGETLPSVDNLYALIFLFGVSMMEMLVPRANIENNGS